MSRKRVGGRFIKKEDEAAALAAAASASQDGEGAELNCGEACDSECASASAQVARRKSASGETLAQANKKKP